jgi:hypothetical protein
VIKAQAPELSHLAARAGASSLRNSAGTNWAGSLQGLLPGAPTDPDVPVEGASGSSRCGIAVPHTTMSFRGDTLVRHGVLSVVPTPHPQRGTPFAPRGPEGPFPRFNTTMGRCDSLPSISPHFVSFVWRLPPFRPLFVPASSGQSCGSSWSW